MFDRQRNIIRPIVISQPFFPTRLFLWHSNMQPVKKVDSCFISLFSEEIQKNFCVRRYLSSTGGWTSAVFQKGWWIKKALSCSRRKGKGCKKKNDRSHIFFFFDIFEIHLVSFSTPIPSSDYV